MYVTDLIRQVQRELTSIDQYNQEMANRIEAQLANTDQIITYADRVPAHRAEDEIAKLQYGLQLLKIGAEFDRVSGRQPSQVSASNVITPQRIELFGSVFIETTAEGEVWINGSREGWFQGGQSTTCCCYRVLWVL